MGKWTFKGVIPDNFDNHTAIGTIAARFYVVSVKTETGFFTPSPKAEAHLILQSKTPKLRTNEKVELPSDWKPQQNEKVVCNMKPFVYRPLQAI